MIKLKVRMAFDFAVMIGTTCILGVAACMTAGVTRWVLVIGCAAGVVNLVVTTVDVLLILLDTPANLKKETAKLRLQAANRFIQ